MKAGVTNATAPCTGNLQRFFFKVQHWCRSPVKPGAAYLGGSWTSPGPGLRGTSSNYAGSVRATCIKPGTAYLGGSWPRPGAAVRGTSRISPGSVRAAWEKAGTAYLGGSCTRSGAAVRGTSRISPGSVRAACKKPGGRLPASKLYRCGIDAVHFTCTPGGAAWMLELRCRIDTGPVQ
ncbi:hypothetical protein SNEBB_006089, partial [Seison nebaliae]